MSVSDEAADSPRLAQPRGTLVETPEAVAAMLWLHEVGWGTRRIARELGSSAAYSASIWVRVARQSG